MGTGDLDLLVATLVPLPGLRVPAGSLQLTFEGDVFSYQADNFVLHIDMRPNQWLEGDGSFLTTGTFSTEDGMLIFDAAGSENQVYTWRAYKDGEVVTTPGIGPQVRLPFQDGGPYRCYPDRLEIDTRGATPTLVTMMFTR